MCDIVINVCYSAEKDFKKYDAVLKSVGLNTDIATRLFLRRVVENRGVPIEVSRSNAKTIVAIKAGKTTDIVFEDF